MYRYQNVTIIFLNAKLPSIVRIFWKMPLCSYVFLKTFSRNCWHHQKNEIIFPCCMLHAADCYVYT